MRLIRLDLIAFGPFTGRSLDFSTSGGSSGLHVIYGPNEAGKTTARKALRVALFGFRHLVEFDFLHDKAALRIGMTIEDGQGRRLSFIRRRGNKRTLLGADGLTELPDEALAPFLLGAGSADDFERSFAIGETELRSGGEAVLRGEGDLSTLLFMTAAGLPRLRAVEGELSKAAEALFLPGGKKPAINEAISRWKELQSQAQARSLPPAEFVQHDTGRKQAKESLLRIEAELAERRGAQARLNRFKQAGPAAARFRQRRLELTEVADAPALPDDFADRREALSRENFVLLGELDQLESSLASLDGQLAELSLPADLLAAAEEIDALYLRLGSHQAAAGDIPQRFAEIEREEAEARKLLSSVWPDSAIEKIDASRLTRQDQAAIRELASQIGSLEARQRQFEESRRKLAERIERMTAETESLGGEQATEPLRAAIKVARREADLDSRLTTAEANEKKQNRQWKTALASLPLWEGTGDDLLRLPVPDEATVARFEKAFDELARQTERLADRRAKTESDLRKAEHDLAALGNERDVPDEEMLHAHRGLRDALWREVRRDLDGRGPGSERDALLADMPDRSLPEAYEASVRDADDTADRLRREAERVERVARLQHEIARHRADLDRSRADEVDLSQRIGQLQEDWNGHWPFLAGTPLTPHEMRSWRERQTRLVEMAHDLDAIRHELQELARRRERHRDALQKAVAELSGETPASMPDDLAASLDRAERVLEELDALNRRRSNLASKRSEAEQELAETEAAAASLPGELDALRHRWVIQMQRLSLPDSTTGEAAQIVLDTLNEVHRKLDAVTALRGRVAGMQADAVAFTEAVSKTTGRIAADLAGQPADVAAATLHERLAEARSQRARRDQLVAQRQSAAEQLEEKRRRANEIAAEMSLLCEQAGCEDPAELPAIESRSARRRDLERQVAEADAELCRHSGGRPVDDFLAELDAIDVDSIDPQLAQLDAEIQRLESESRQVSTEIGRHEQALSTMQGDAAAADAAEEAEAVLATLAGDVERYVRYRLAAKLLRVGRDRYRDKTGSAVLDQASAFFRRLTCGAFESLKVDFGDNDEPTLMGQRSGGGKPVRPDAMSDGTTDQLYLALRLAWLHAWLEDHPPLPLVVDDLLIHFDDDRARAALELLSELSERTQVLFFTHHEHLVELAEQTVGADKLAIHDLRDVRDLSLELETAANQRG